MITDLPPIVQIVVLRYLAQVLGWLSGLVYELWLEQVAEHELVQLRARLNLCAVELACTGYYRAGGRGAPPQHTVHQLVHVLLLKHWYGESCAGCAARLRYEWLLRWFAGYRLDQTPPSASTIHRFEQWVESHHGRSYFDALLRQRDASDPDTRTLPQIGDTFALHALAPRSRCSSGCATRTASCSRRWTS